MTHDVGRASVSWYWRGCRCRSCRAERAAYEQARRSARRTVPVDVILAHLRSVPEHLKAQIAGVSKKALWQYRHRRRTRVQHAIAQRILALPSKRCTYLVPSYRTKQLLHALKGEDWTLEAIAKELAVTTETLRCRGRLIRRTTADKVEALYQRFESDAWDGKRQQPEGDRHARI